MKNKKWKIFCSLLVVILGGLFFWGKMRSGKSAGEVTNTLKPTYGSIRAFITTTGTVQPQNRLEIKPPISGRVEEILVKEGDEVKIGQTLAWMSSTERAALLDAARSYDKKTLKTWQDVYKPTPLLAPIDGKVIVRAVEPGQTVTSADTLIVLSDRLIVKAQVDETDIGKVRLGQPAIITLDAYPQIKVKSSVDHISYESKVVNNVTMYEVDILPEKVPEVFRSGMSANIDIIEESKDNVLTLPVEAVNQDKEGSFVFLSQGPESEPEVRRITLGIANGDGVEILSGLKADDVVVIKSQNLFTEKKEQEAQNPFMPSHRRR